MFGFHGVFMKHYTIEKETIIKYQLMRFNIQAIDTKQLNREIKCWCVKRNLQ